MSYGSRAFMWAIVFWIAMAFTVLMAFQVSSAVGGVALGLAVMHIARETVETYAHRAYQEAAEEAQMRKQMMRDSRKKR